MKYIILIISLLSVISCSNNQVEDKANPIDENHLHLTDEQLKSFKLATAIMQEQTIVQTLKLNGIIDVPPQNLVSVSAAMGGYLKSTKLLPGSHFDKGEVLAILEDNQYIQLQQDYLTTKIQLQNAKSEYLRQKELNQNKASSDKVYQQAKSEFETLEVNKAALAQKLKMINIKPEKVNLENISKSIKILAPFDGYVTKVIVNVGKYISASDVLFELVDPRDLHLNLKVFEKDWDKIKIGEPVISYTNSNPEKKHHGELILIGKNISEDRAVETHAHFDKYDPSLIPGMYMNAEIKIPNSKIWSVPERAVVSYQGKNYVFKQIDKNNFEMLEIKLGKNGDAWVQVENFEKLKNLNIVNDGAYTLLMALKNKGEEE